MANPECIYRFQELTTGVVIEDLPVTTQSGLPRAVSQDANATFTLPLGDEDIQALDFKNATTPGRTAVFYIEDGVPLWGGMVWARQYKKSSRLLTITAATIESYWRSRVMRAPINVKAMDLYSIFVFLLTGTLPVGGDWKTLNPDGTITDRKLYHQQWIQDYDGSLVAVADTLASVQAPIAPSDGAGGFWWAATVAAGTLRDQSWGPGKVVYDAISDLCSSHGGMEWTARPTIFDTGALGWVIDLGAPTLGSTFDKTGLDWTSTIGWSISNQGTDPDDNIEDYTFSEDVRSSANHQINTGAQISGVPLVSDLADLSSVRSGYPVLEQSAAYSDVVYQSTLDLHASGDLAANALPIAVSQWSVSADDEPEFNTYQLGDEALFRVSDPLDPQQPDGTPGRTSLERIVGWTYFPPSAGNRRRVDLITNPKNQASSKTPPSVKRRMDLLQAKLDGITSTGAGTPIAPVGVGNTGTVSVALAAGGGSPVAQKLGTETLVSSLVFYRQADVLTFAVTVWLGGPADAADVNSLMGFVLRDGEDNSLLSGDLTVPFDPSAAGGGWIPENLITPYQIWTFEGSSYNPASTHAAFFHIPLNQWEFGELINLQLLAQTVNLTASAQTQIRNVKIFSAVQG